MPSIFPSFTPWDPAQYAVRKTPGSATSYSGDIGGIAAPATPGALPGGTSTYPFSGATPSFETAIQGLLAPGLVPDVARQSAEVSAGRGIAGSPAAGSTSVRMSEQDYLQRLQLANALQSGEASRVLPYNVTPFQRAELDQRTQEANQRFALGLAGLNRPYGGGGGGSSPSGGGRVAAPSVGLDVARGLLPGGGGGAGVGAAGLPGESYDDIMGSLGTSGYGWTPSESLDDVLMSLGIGGDMQNELPSWLGDPLAPSPELPSFPYE